METMQPDLHDIVPGTPSQEKAEQTKALFHAAEPIPEIPNQPEAPIAFQGQPLISEFPTPVPGQPTMPSSHPTPTPPAQPRPVQQPALYQSPASPRRKRPGNVWITILRVFAWVLFVLIIAGGAAYGVYRAYDLYAMLTSIEAILTIGVCSLVAIVAAFLMISSVMVWLNLARDVSAVRIEIEEQTRR